jgi:hypothetical protein
VSDPIRVGWLVEFLGIDLERGLGKVMIRSSLMKAIYDVLGSHPYLALEDFTISEFLNRNGYQCLSIAYRYNSTWQFNFTIPKAKQKRSDMREERYLYGCAMSPGHESTEESLNAEERAGLLSEVRGWLNRLYEDSISAPLVRQLQAHSSALEKLTKRLEQLPD